MTIERVSTPRGTRAGAGTRRVPPHARNRRFRARAALALAFAAACAAVPARAQTCYDCLPGGDPPPGLILREPPELSLAPHHGGFVDTGAGAATLAYATPAYVSRDVPRSVSLVYNSTQARGIGFVQVDVTESTTETPQKRSIQVYGAGGAALTPETFYLGSTGASRLAATWNEATSAYLHRVVVRTYYADGAVTTAETQARVLVVNEEASHFGAGWSMPGLQRVYPASDGALVVNGDGTAVFFSRACSTCAYQAPEGEFSTLAQRADGSWARVSAAGDSAVFTGTGLISRYTDRAGRMQKQFTWTTAADGWSIPTAVIDPTGARYTLGYLGSGYLRTLTDPGGRVSTVGYAIADVAWITGPDGRYAVQATSDAYHRVTSYRDAPGGLYDVAYDHTGALASITAPPVSTTDAGTARPVSRNSSLWAAVLPGPGLGTSSAPGARVDPAAVRVSATDPRGAVVKAAVDRYGAPTRVEEPYGRITTIDRNPHGQITRTVSPTGHATTATWNGVELVRVVDEAAHDTTFTDYEHTFHQPTYVRHAQQRDSMYYDASGMLQTLVRLGGTRRVQQYAYTGDGRVSSVTDPEGHGTFFTYEGAATLDNRSTATVGMAGYAGNRTVTYAHDALGRDTLATAPTGEKTRTGYDALNRVVRSTDALGGSTLFAFDSAGLSTVTDARSQVYRYTRNVLGWVVAATDPRGASVTYQHDRAGNLTGTTNRRAQAITATYDSLNRVVSRNAAGAVTTWSYDPGWRWTQVGNAAGTDRFEADSAGRLVRTVTTRGASTYNQTVAYNAAGLATSMAVTGPWAGTRTLGYGYGAANRLVSITDFSGGITTMDYDGDGTLTTRATPGYWQSSDYGSTHTPTFRGDNNYSYSPRGQVEKWRIGEATEFRSYEYDALGRLGYARNYRDPANLKCLVDENGVETCTGTTTRPTFLGSTTYTYDAVGNRTDRSAVLATGNRVTSMGGYALEYDADGNVTRRNGNGQDVYMTWDALGQMTSVTVNGSRVDYGYDGLGRWAYRQPAGGSATEMVYDGDHLLLERDAASGVVNEYTYYPGMDEPHGMRRNGTQYYFEQDYPGNVIAIRSAAGAVVSQYSYTPWGERATGTSETVANPLQYAGRYYEPSAKIYQVRARWYDPALGRFLSEDPVGLDGGINPYAYANDDPTDLRDPSGLKVCDPYCALDGIVATGFSSGFGSMAGLGWGTAGPMGGIGGGVLGGLFGGGGATGGGTGGGTPSAAPAQAQRDPKQCYENNRFSSLFGGGAASSVVEFAETGSLISVGTDLVAIGMKSARSGVGGPANRYAGGIRMISKRVGRAVGSETIEAVGHRVGDKVTPVLAVFAAFTVAYNTTIEAQCRMGLLD